MQSVSNVRLQEPDNSGEYLDVNDLERLTKISKSTWDKKRLTGDGPRFIKIGRAVRYRLSDVEAWLAAHAVSSTSEVRAA